MAYLLCAKDNEYPLLLIFNLLLLKIILQIYTGLLKSFYHPFFGNPNVFFISLGTSAPFKEFFPVKIHIRRRNKTKFISSL